MWGLDGLTIFKFVFLGVVVLIAFLQILYKAFVRPLQNAEEERRRQEARGQDPAMEIRDFLAEIRGEKVVRVPMPRAGGAEGPGKREVFWEVLEEMAPPPRGIPNQPPPRSTTPVPTSVRTKAKKPSGERARPKVEAPASRPETGEPALAPQVESELEQRLPWKYDSTAAQPIDKQPPAKLPFGVSVRDALVATVILGPPRCRRRPGPRQSPANPPGTPIHRPRP